jgi:hypothetical protein
MDKKGRYRLSYDNGRYQNKNRARVWDLPTDQESTALASKGINELNASPPETRTLEGSWTGRQGR